MSANADFVNDPRPSFERAHETQWLIDRLVDRLHEQGAVVGYDELAECCGHPIPGRGEDFLGSALKILAREHPDWVVVRVRGKRQVRRLTDKEIPEHVAEVRRPRIRGQALSGMRELSAISDLGALDPHRRQEVNVERTLLAMHEIAARRETIEKATKETMRMAPPKSTRQLLSWLWTSSDEAKDDDAVQARAAAAHEEGEP